MAFLLSLYYLRNQIIVICENCIYAHFNEFFCFVLFIRPEHIAVNSVFMCLINHFLIEIRFKKLNLFTAKLAVKEENRDHFAVKLDKGMRLCADRIVIEEERGFVVSAVGLAEDDMQSLSSFTTINEDETRTLYLFGDPEYAL